MSTDHVNDPVREEFSKLDLDGKTAFLVEAIFSTAGSAINEIGARLNGLVTLVTSPIANVDNDPGADQSASAPDAESAPETAKKASGGASPGTARKGKREPKKK